MNAIPHNIITREIEHLSRSTAPVKIIDNAARRLNVLQADPSLLDLQFIQHTEQSSLIEEQRETMLSLRLRCLQRSGSSLLFERGNAIELLSQKSSDLFHFTLRNLLMAAWRKGQYNYFIWLFECVLYRCNENTEDSLTTLWNLDSIIFSAQRELGLNAQAHRSSLRCIQASEHLSKKYELEYSHLLSLYCLEEDKKAGSHLPFATTPSSTVLAGTSALDSINSSFVLISSMRNAILDGNMTSANTLFNNIQELRDSLPPSTLSVSYVEEARLELANGNLHHAIGRMEDAAWILSWYPDSLANMYLRELVATIDKKTKLPPELLFSSARRNKQLQHSIHRLESAVLIKWREHGLSNLFHLH